MREREREKGEMRARREGIDTSEGQGIGRRKDEEER